MPKGYSIVTMAKFILYLSILIASGLTRAQIPIPKEPLGFPYGQEGNSQVQLDAFLDLACPDSKAAFPVLKQVADHYGVTKLRLNAVMFPLPYHRAAWLSAQSTHVVHEMNSKVTFTWMADYFAVQEKLFNTPAVNKSDEAIMNFIADVAGKVVDRSTFLSKLMGDDGDTDARIMWKYSCSRTISGTPQYLINGVHVDASASWTVKQWQQVLDPLFGKKVSRELIVGPNCTQGTSACEYLPQKYQCCLAGEDCIPNVGCRC